MVGILVVLVVLLMLTSSTQTVHAQSWTLLDGGGSPDAVGLASAGHWEYLAARSADQRIWLRSEGCPSGGICTGWTAWTLVPGLTDVPPALAVFKSDLFIFAKQAGSNNIWYGHVTTEDIPPGYG